jgi:hypothetical protein
MEGLSEVHFINSLFSAVFCDKNTQFIIVISSHEICNQKHFRRRINNSLWKTDPIREYLSHPIGIPSKKQANKLRENSLLYK